MLWTLMKHAFYVINHLLKNAKFLEKFMKFNLGIM